MDLGTRLKEKNRMKVIGSLSVVLATLFMGNYNDLINIGPGVVSGICLSVAVICMVLASKRG